MELWRIARLAAWACLIGMVLVIAFAENMTLGYIFLLAFYPLMIFSGIAKSKDPYVKRTKEEKKAQREARQNVEKRERLLDSTPVAAELISMNGKMRGATVVGGLTGGIPGAVVGAYLGKQRATFAVQYASGRIDVETVAVNSQRFKILSAFLEK